ncbi:MGMT family protein [Streptomyces albus]|nr:MGMT family protein [Streptomyces albus]
MVARGTARREHEGAFRGSRGGIGGPCAEAVDNSGRLSVACGNMARMPGNSRSEALSDGHAAPSDADVPALPDYAERVLDLAESIPAGRVMTYGDIAEWLEEGGPRQVGRVMALYGGAVCWWRVVRADGVPLAGKEHEALAHYHAEGTPLRENTAASGAPGHIPRIDIRRARWDGRSG